MALNPNMLKWFARIGVILAGGGLIFTFFPFICYIAPFLSQAAVAMGLVAFVQSSKDDESQTYLLSIAAMVVGLLALVIAALMYILKWSLF